MRSFLLDLDGRVDTYEGCPQINSSVFCRQEVLSLVLRSLHVIVTSAVPFTSMTSMTSATTASLPTTTRLVTSCGDPASGAVSVGEDLQVRHRHTFKLAIIELEI